MTPAIRSAIQSGNLILFLGAGASIGARNRLGEELIGSERLGAHLAERAGLEYQNELLPAVYAAARAALGSDQTERLLEGAFRHCRPSPDQLALARFPWRRIYTVNIDDSLEAAFREASHQNIAVRYRNDPIAH